MDIRRTLLRSVPALALAGVLSAGVASVSNAQNAANYGKYYGAIRAHELCQGVEFDQSQYAALTRAIDRRMNANLTAGESLAVIEAAQNEAWELVFKFQCDGEPVRELLALFASDLETAAR